MNVYFESLYSEIIENYLNKYDTLNVISGYASANFLNNVLIEYPTKEFNIYIGMTHQGISYKDHETFLKLCMKYPKVNIFYQIKGKPTHIKALEFSDSSEKITFVGSANFSEAGFLKHREVMALIEYDLQQKINEQKEVSLHCSNPKILEYISLIDEESMNIDLEIIEENEHKSNNIIKHDVELHKCVEIFNEKHNINFTGKNNGNLVYLELPIVVNNNVDGLWRELGINARNSAYITNSNLQRKKMVEFFRRNHTFIVKTFNGKETRAELKGKFGKELFFHDFDLNDYMRNLIGKTENEIITNNDLEEFGYDSIYFKKVNDEEFLMTLHNSSNI